MTGVYDAGPAASVALYQRRAGLRVDGHVGPVTTLALNGDRAAAQAETRRRAEVRRREREDEISNTRERRMATTQENRRIRGEFVTGRRITAPGPRLTATGRAIAGSLAEAEWLLHEAAEDEEDAAFLRETLVEPSRPRRRHSTDELLALLGPNGGAR